MEAYSEYQRYANNQYVKNDYIYPNTTIKGTAKAHYLIRYEENEQCGYRRYVADYNFSDPNASNFVIDDQNPSNNLILEDKPLDCGLDAYIGQLQSWLQTKNMSKAAVYVSNCNTGKVTLVTSTGQGEVANLTPNQAKTNVQNRNFTTDFAIYACKQADGSWDITIQWFVLAVL